MDNRTNNTNSFDSPITIPDTATIAFWGVVKSFAPNANVEGTQPTANIEIVPTNKNASDVETVPDVTEA